jgi:hypothetical protein
MSPSIILSDLADLPAALRDRVVRTAKAVVREAGPLGLRYHPQSGTLELFWAGSRSHITGKPTPQLRARKRGRGDRVWSGSIRVAEGASWHGRLEVPSSGGSALLTLERKGRGAALLPADASLAVPNGEAGALRALLEGLLAKVDRNRGPHGRG